MNSAAHFLGMRRGLCRLLAVLPGDETPPRCLVRDLIVLIDSRLTASKPEESFDGNSPA